MDAATIQAELQSFLPGGDAGAAAPAEPAQSSGGGDNAPAGGNPQGQAAPAQPAEPQKPAEFDYSSLKITELAQKKGISDEKIVKLLDLVENGGDLNAYIADLNENIDALPETELLRRQVYEKYADFSDEEKELMYQDELQKYKADPELFTEEEIKRGQIRLRADLKDYKAQLKQQQLDKAFTKATEGRNAQQAGAEDIQAYIKELSASEAYKGLDAGTLKIPDGAQGFNLDVNKDAVMGFLTDAEQYAKAFIGQDGKPDYQKQLMVAAFATDIPGFIDKIGKHFQKLNLIKDANLLGNEGLNGAGQPAQGQSKDAIDLLLEKVDSMR